MRLRTPEVVTLLPAVLAVLMIMALAGCSREEPEPEPETVAMERAKALQTMATQSYDSAGARADSALALPRMIDFGRGKCIPCKKMEPILHELKQAYAGSAVIEIVNLDEEPHAADMYKLRIIPTQVFFDTAGTEVWRHEGFLPRDAIVAKFTEMGVEPLDD